MAITDLSEIKVAVPVGYQPTNDFIGSVSRQLGLRQVHLRLELGDIVRLIDRPDPAARYEHNRRIDVGHAKDFSHYLLRGAKDKTVDHKHQPMIPAICLFTDPDDVTIESFLDLPSETFGTIKIDKNAKLAIWDGQHRVLGMHIGVDDLAEEIRRAKESLETARRTYEPGAPESQVTAKAEVHLADLVESRKRLLGMSVPLVLTLTSDQQRVGAIFSDLNDKQKGMASSVVTRLDDRVVFNRAATELSTHDYLEGLVDHESDSTTGANPNWISLRDVAEVAKLAWLGFGGRWNDSREDGVDDDAVTRRAREFFEMISESFSDLQQVLIERTLEPKDLRRNGTNPSLLASASTTKALAVAYHDLLEGSGYAKSSSGRVTRVSGLTALDHEAIKVAVAKKLPPMDSGEGVLDERWINTQVFELPFIAPTARGSNVRTLAMHIMDWVRSSPAGS
jgi:hypothetical protein